MGNNLLGFFKGTEMPTAGWWEALWPDPAGVLTAVGIKPGLEVIDLCSGDGWFTLPMTKIARYVTAIDIDALMIEAGRIRLARAGVTNYGFAQGDAYAIAELAPRPADLVFMANAFHGVPDQPRLVRAVREALNPAGRFAIINWHQRPREETVVLGEPRGPRTELRMSPKQTISVVEAGGLKFANLTEIPPYHYGAVFEQPSA